MPWDGLLNGTTANLVINLERRQPIHHILIIGNELITLLISQIVAEDRITKTRDEFGSICLFTCRSEMIMAISTTKMVKWPSGGVNNRGKNRRDSPTVKHGPHYQRNLEVESQTAVITEQEHIHSLQFDHAVCIIK